MAKKTQVEKASEEAQKAETEEKQSTEEDSKSSEESKTEEQETKTEEKAEEGFKPRYPNLWQGDIEKYLRAVEKNYGESSQEGVRLHEQLTEKEKEMQIIQKVVQANPELKEGFTKSLYGTGYENQYDDEELTLANIARVVDEKVDKKLEEKVPQLLGQNPTLQSIENERTLKDREAVAMFQELHPELVTDQILAKKMETAVSAVAQMDAVEGRKFDFESGLSRAWEIVTGEKTSNEELEGMKKMIQKEQATSQQTASGKEQASGQKRTLSDAEKNIAANLGLSEEDYLKGKEMSEEAKQY